MKPNAVIHITLDAFFLSLELRKRPELGDKPVIVGGHGLPSRRGVVSAASREARRSGVRTGMPLNRAQKLCPEAVCLPLDYDTYEQESERFMAILRESVPLVESFGLDEAFIGVEAGERMTEEGLFKKAESSTRKMQERVNAQLGVGSSAGIGPNKLIAWLADRATKSGGIEVIRKNDAAGFLRDLPVRRLPGMERETEARLRALGITTIGGLSKAPLLFLKRNFAPATARALYEQSRGIDSSPVIPFDEPGAICREVTFDRGTGDPALIKETIYEQVDYIAARLKHSNAKCAAVTVKIGSSDLKTITVSHDLEAETGSMNDIWGAALHIFEEMDLNKKVRLVGVKASRLS